MMNKNSYSYLLSHHRLLWRISINELRGRYAGALLGKAWIVLAPLLILGVYAIIYTLIFEVRPTDIGRLQYVLHLFAGMIPFLMMNESLANGVVSVVSNKAVLNNTVFPIDLAPPKAVLMAQGTIVAGFISIFTIEAITFTVPWTFIFFPVIWGLSLLALSGLAWILSMLNIVFRDLKDLISVIMMMLFIASPIAYTPSMVPDSLKFLLLLNPFAYYVSAFQAVTVHGRLPGVFHILFLFVFSFGLFFLGSWVFSRSKRVLIDYV